MPWADQATQIGANKPSLRGDIDMPKHLSQAELEQLGGYIQNELQRAEGADEDNLQANRAAALNYYWGQPLDGDQDLADKGRSVVISSDVADMVNATLAMLVPMLSIDCVVEFEPDSEEDELQAGAESDVINRVIIEENQGFIQIQEAVKDALLLKNGVMKCTVVERETVASFDLGDGISNAELGSVVEQLPPNAVAEVDGDKLKVTTTEVTFETTAVPVERVSYTSAYIGKFQDVPFWAEQINYTRSELVELGIDRKLVDSLPSSGVEQSGSDAARLARAVENRDGETRDQDLIRCHNCYYKIDLDGDGISERYNILVADTHVVLEHELADLIPYAIGSAFLNPHRITGESLFDHLRQTQDTKTTYNRQLIDNVSIINNGRYAYDPGQVSEDDVLKPKAGGGIRARNPSQSIVPIIIPDVTGGILQALAYEDQRRSERGGASLDLLNSNSQIVGDTASGIERQYSSREAMASMMATNLSETLIRGIYLITHEMMRRFSNEPVMVRQAGQYVPTNPTEWPARQRVNVATGMSPGERGHLQQTLQQHIQLQVQAMSQGMAGVLASPQTVYRTTMDWLRLAGVDNPERHAIDPSSQQAQQTQEQQGEQAAAEAKAQQDTLDRALGVEEAKVQQDADQAAGELEHKYYNTDVDALIAQAKLQGQGVIDMNKQRLINESANRATKEGTGSGDTSA